jgi:glycosyltransferase involved in cell wall biosynthesis
MTISAIIITYNEEKNIRDCIESLKWADEIIVVDAESQDRTAKTAEELGVRTYSQKWQGYGKQKNYALGKATCDWILSIDADERVTPELAKEIQEELVNPSFSGYKIPRKAYFLGKWIRHGGWYPGYVLRLFQAGKARFAEKEVHEYLELNSKAGYLKNPLLHYTDDTLDHYLDKFCKYTSLASKELYVNGKRASLSDLFLRPILFFLKMYIAKCGFLDGIHGFILATLSSFYVFVKYAKLWEKDQAIDFGP